MPKSVLVASCSEHPRYTGEQKPTTNCHTCWLIYVMRWQHDKNGEDKLGSLNPFAYLIDHVKVKEACEGIKLRKKELTTAD